MERSSGNRTISALVLLLLIVTTGAFLTVGEGRVCQIESKSFKGLCLINPGCVTACKKEGFKYGGKCSGARDRAYNSLGVVQDADGKAGILLTKDVMPVSNIAICKNLRVLGPFVLPYWEQVHYLWSIIAKLKVPYVPSFGKAFDHICVHAGGRAVIDEAQKGLRLSDEQVEASRMTLHRFGNTSSSSIWYEVGYLEAKGRMKKGQKIWQIGLGSGFKCNNAVWKSMKDVKKTKEGAWYDCIDKYPVDIPDIIKML